MNLDAALIEKLVPLYAIIVLGFLSGKFLHVKRESIAALLIYIIAPVVVFYGVSTTPLTLSTLSLPLLFFFLGTFTAILGYVAGRFMWKTSEKNIFAFAAGTGNTGYFGIPVAVGLFGDNALGLAVLCTLGLILFENSIGFFLVARGSHTVKEALRKLIKLPSLYAFFLGIAINRLHVDISPAIMDTLTLFRGSYSVLGMMLIGLGIATVTRSAIDPLFTVSTHIAKFIVWPALTLAILFLDMQIFHLYSPSVASVILLLSLTPLASNTVAFATHLNVHPEKAALSVLVSTLFAVLYIPLFMSYIFPLIHEIGEI